MSVMNAAVQEIDGKIADLQRARATLMAVMGAGSAPTRRGNAPAGETRTRKPMTEESKQKIREAQARRWAKPAAGAAPPVAGLTVPPAVPAKGPAPDKAKAAEAGKPADTKK